MNKLFYVFLTCFAFNVILVTADVSINLILYIIYQNTKIIQKICNNDSGKRHYYNYVFPQKCLLILSHFIKVVC